MSEPSTPMILDMLVERWAGLHSENQTQRKRIAELEAKVNALLENCANLLAGMEYYAPSLGQKWLVETEDIDAIADWMREKAHE